MTNANKRKIYRRATLTVMMFICAFTSLIVTGPTLATFVLCGMWFGTGALCGLEAVNTHIWLDETP